MEHTKPTRSRKPKMPTQSFELPINGNTYLVNATPYILASGELQYRISYNNGPIHIFAWDEGLDRYAESDPQADVIPPVIEIAIAGKLNEYAHQVQHAA